MKIVSKSVNKIDGMELAMGKSLFVDDLCPKDALHIKLLRSPYPFAKIKHIDTELAKQADGVKCVLTYQDVPEKLHTIAAETYPEPSPYDRMLLGSTVRYVGDPVAVVAAESLSQAEQAVALIRVEYEIVEPVLDFEQAKDHRSLLHQPTAVFTNFDVGSAPLRNIAAAYNRKHEDVEKALNECDIVLEETFYTQAQAHAMLETHRAFTYLDGRGRLVIVSSTQSAFHVRRIVAAVLNMPQSSIRVIKPRVGGAFGGKNIVLIEGFAAFVTLKTGKPAKIIYDRRECMTCTNSRHAMRIKVRLGADKEGLMKALDVEVLSNTGAYGEHAPDVLCVSCTNTLPIYGQPMAVRYSGTAVYTNKVSAGAFRGFGAPQSNFAIESMVNLLAAKLALDPIFVRKRNIICQGGFHPFLNSGQKPPRVTSCSLDQCIRRGKELIGWEQKYPCRKLNNNKVRGVGMAVAMHGSGIIGVQTAVAELRLNDGGSYSLFVGSADLGTGSDTILAQIAAEILETTVENIYVLSADTDLTPYNTGAYASCTTYITGNAVLKAAKLLREEIIKQGAVCCKKDTESIQFDGNSLSSADGIWQMTLADFAAWSVSGKGAGQLSVSSTAVAEESPPPFVAGFAEVEVDITSGQVQVINFAAVVDCGTLINPTLARVQAEGGIAQGIGFAMFEEVRYTKAGRMLADNFVQYHIPTRQDVGNIMVEFAPSYESTGPFGAKSVGEVVFTTPPPSIADAIYNAVGVRVTELPITSEQVLRGIRNL